MDNDWTKIRIGDVCKLKPGVQIEVAPDESGNLIDLSYYKAHDIANNLCLKESSRKIPENKIEPFQAGTLLVTCGGKIGRLGILKEQAYASPNISGIQIANGNLLPEYLFYWLLYHNDYFQKRASGTKMRRLNLKEINSIPVHYPCVKDQQSIADQIKKSLKLKDETQSINPKKLKKIKLPKTFTLN
jgi:restriction endonuclease S subunit